MIYQCFIRKRNIPDNNKPREDIRYGKIDEISEGL